MWKHAGCYASSFSNMSQICIVQPTAVKAFPFDDDDDDDDNDDLVFIFQQLNKGY
jgi:hypothetical protein